MSGAITKDVVRCSALARVQELDPIGTAGSYRGFLLLELALPWPRDIRELPGVESIGRLLQGHNIRVQAVVPQGDDTRQAVLYRSPEGPFCEMVRHEVSVTDGDLFNAVAELLQRPDAWESMGGKCEVLVCTHGRRDVCCGSLGTALTRELQQSGPGGDEFVWRTSHTGGHRFAPTFLVLPSATMWAYADAALVDQIRHRRGNVADVIDRYRGCAGLGSRSIQAVEREVLRRVGWTVLDQPRWGIDQGHGRTQLVLVRPDGDHDIWEGVVELGRRVPIPDCGRPIGEARKFEDEIVVRDVKRIESAPVT